MKVTLRASAWADTWEGKASAPTLVGVRLVAEADLARSRSEAERNADRLHPGRRSDAWTEAYNQALMHFVIGCALCRHDDVSEPLFEMQDFVISHRLSSAGTLRLWDAVVELGVIDSPLSPEISVDGCEALARSIVDDAWWERLPKRQRAQVGRLLQRAVEIAAGGGGG